LLFSHLSDSKFHFLTESVNSSLEITDKKQADKKKAIAGLKM